MQNNSNNCQITSENFKQFKTKKGSIYVVFIVFEVISQILSLTFIILELDCKDIHFPIVKMSNLRLKLRDLGRQGKSYSSRNHAFYILVGALYSKPSHLYTIYM